jgi:hypothetical protein
MDSACIAAVGEYLNKNTLNRARFNYQLLIMAVPRSNIVTQWGLYVIVCNFAKVTKIS